MPRYAIILIAGSGRRWGSGDKCLLEINGIPIAIYSLKAFISSGLFGRYFFVYRDDDQKNRLQKYVEKHFAEYTAVISWVPGGETRHRSVFRALQYISDHAEPESYVFIHDGARPLLAVENLYRLAQALSPEVGATLAHRVTNTILEADDPSAAAPRNYLQRDRLWAIETPQAFYFPHLFEDYLRIVKKELPATKDSNRDSKNCAETRYTDDTSIYSGPIKLIENRVLNPKLTHPEDLALIDYLLSRLPAGR